MQFMNPEPPHVLFSTDSLETQNGKGDHGLEASTSPWFNINTGWCGLDGRHHDCHNERI